ncbi:MAG: hypothetical protein LBQ10_05675 [Desulfovibrio sp.]|jgi:hypothetical protein|nr:hypothetical protein [Desulfovibrio sp.]
MLELCGISANNPLSEGRGLFVPPESIDREPAAEDVADFQAIVGTELTAEQEDRIRIPDVVHPEQRHILAVHWHPEFIPVPLVRERMGAMFPAVEEELCIPTQHNELLALNGFSGVEVDCFSSEFNQKIQLLAHFQADRVAQAATFRAMLDHTRNYRRAQLGFLLDALGAERNGSGEIARRAAGLSGADESVVAFAAAIAHKLRSLIERHRGQVARGSLKNKLVRNFLNRKRGVYGDTFISRVQVYVNEVKVAVKAAFSPEYYYETREIIEEIRGLGGCVVIPHPEQFWPVLLAGYDVDGYEVWNPQSRRYTEFLISVVAEQNRNRPKHRRELLVFMGDDCHMSEKILTPAERDPLKAEREVGLQPAWDDLNIRRKLMANQACRELVIRRYRERLSG